LNKNKFIKNLLVQLIINPSKAPYSHAYPVPLIVQFPDQTPKSNLLRRSQSALSPPSPIRYAPAPAAAARLFLPPPAAGGQRGAAVKLLAEDMREPEHHLPVLGGGAGPAAVRAAGIPAQVQQQRRVPEPLQLPGVSGGKHLPQEPVPTCGGLQPAARHRLPRADFQRLDRVPATLLQQSQQGAALPREVHGVPTGAFGWVSQPALRQLLLRPARRRPEFLEQPRPGRHPAELLLRFCTGSCGSPGEWRRVHRQLEEGVSPGVDRGARELPGVHCKRRGMRVRRQRADLRLQMLRQLAP
jgi:hypothetical protein